MALSQESLEPKIIYQDSAVTHAGSTYTLLRLDVDEKRLRVQGNENDFIGDRHSDGLICALTPHNAAVMRSRLPWLNPVPLGMHTSFGFGDRLGSATPGHIRALRTADPTGKIAPIFAQQSVRENTRIGRTPQEVMDAATWGIFQAGWRKPWGADADHVKELADLPPFVAAGYTFYTVDPSDHVDNAAQNDDLTTLQGKAAILPWDILQSSYEDMRARYCQGPFLLNGLTLTFDDHILQQALVKYGGALAHTITIAQALAAQMNGSPYDLEMSIDETDTPTSIYEHFFIANELHRCQVPVVSIAPRFVGKFQKGVDYIGDLDEFERELMRHAAVMHHFGDYKLSIHTGSDKFSIYATINQHANGRIHVKTAGTSYLEALRVATTTNPTLFRQILDLAHERFEHDRKTYFLDCQPHKVPTSAQVADDDLPNLLDEFHARQLLHVTFGSALDVYGRSLAHLIAQHEGDYQVVLMAHFERHLTPFV